MLNARSAKGWSLQSFQSGALGIVRLLLLALSLQIALPVVDGLASVRIDSFTADLNSSLCHDGSVETPGAPAQDTSRQSRHCLFCLPLTGDHATQTAEFSIPAPKTVAVATLAIGDQRQSLSSPYVLAHSRAPPRESGSA
ncbi:MAG: hypothetical protein Q7R40_15955 [Phaeospirillum sp.]|nr:hypothetical protein [Phaeospirillum sp.]